jgi:hypothetical protein
MVLAANPGADNTVTGEPQPIQVQMNETAQSASLGSTAGTTINIIPTAPTPANSEVQVQVVIEAAPGNTVHPTDSQNMMADVLTTAYHMVADNMCSTFASGTSW